MLKCTIPHACRTQVKHTTALSLLQPACAARECHQPAMGSGYPHFLHAQGSAACHRVRGLVVSADHGDSSLRWICLRPGPRFMEPVWLAGFGLFSHLRTPYDDRSRRRSFFANHLHGSGAGHAVRDHFLQLHRRSLSGIACTHRAGSTDARKAQHLIKCFHSRRGSSRVLRLGLDVHPALTSPGLSVRDGANGHAWCLWILETASHLQPCL